MTTVRASKLLTCLLLALLPGCATGRANLWPVFFHETRRVPTPQGPQTVTTTEFLYPLFTRQSREDGTWHAVRPFYNYEHRRENGRHRVQYLWPLGLHFKDGDKETHHRLFPLFEYQKSWSPKTKKHAVHAHLLQLLRWGSDDEWGPYFALIPLGGVTHGVIADTWSFALFPLYSHYRQGDYVRNDLPWPVLGYGRTPDGTRKMYRLWPLFVSQVKDDPRERRTRYDLLWPLVRWGRVVPTRGRYYHTVAVVTPFYSHVKRFDRQGDLIWCLRSFLGVSFCTGALEQGDRTGWSVLWSLARKVSTNRSDEFRILPFYWRTTRYSGPEKDPERSWTRYRAPWPLVWIDSDRSDPDHHKGGLVVAPLYWHYTDTYPAENGPARKGRRITLWPLVTWERGPAGDHHLWLASRGWKDASKGFKRNYRAFFDLFQHHRHPDGRKETRLLWRLYHHRRGPDGRYLSLAGLFTYDGTGEVVGEEGKYVSALFGLVKCSWRGQARRWRILYIPLGAGGGANGEEDAAAL